MEGGECPECGYEDEDPDEDGDGDSGGDNDHDADDRGRGNDHDADDRGREPTRDREPVRKGVEMAQTQQTQEPEVAVWDDAELVGIVNEAATQAVVNATPDIVAAVVKAISPVLEEHITKAVEPLQKALTDQTEETRLVKGFMDEISRGPAARTNGRQNGNGTPLRKAAGSQDLDLDGGDGEVNPVVATAVLSKGLELGLPGVTYAEVRRAQVGEQLPSAARVAELQAEIQKALSANQR